MKLYLTGGTGSLGTGIQRYFRHNEISSSSINILHRDELEKSIKNSNCNAIIHAAAIVGSSSCDAFGRNYTYKVNVDGTQNVIDIAKKLELKMIHFSSTAIYGNKEEGVITEETRPHLNSSYSSSKWLSEIAVIDNMEPKMRMIVRPVMVYHTRDSFTNQKSINYVIKSILNREPQISLNLDPNTYKTYTHIEDFCNILEGLINNKRWGDVFNISCGEYRKEKVKTIFDYISNKLENKETEIIFRPDRDTLGNHIISNRKATRYSKVRPKYNIYQGIDEMLREI